MHPDGGAVGNLARGCEFVVGDRETQLADDVPERSIVGGVEHDLIAGDGGARGACHRIDRLDAVEEGNLVAFDERSVVVDDSLRELRHGSCGGDGEGAESDAAHELVAGILGHANARQGAAGNLVGCKDGTAVEFHPLGDVHLHDTEIGLDEGVVNAHVLW